MNIYVFGDETKKRMGEISERINALLEQLKNTQKEKLENSKTTK
jgi:hypothetical protein